MDFYQAASDNPTPLVFYIHGGGWQNGDKKTNPKAFLDEGISVVAINYRYMKQAVEEKIEPPVKAPQEDAARALQFVRSKAGEWNLDKKRIGATGGSAGACSSLWLAFQDDMADPKSDDPIARESTRLYCAAVNGAQVSLDPKELREWRVRYCPTIPGEYRYWLVLNDGANRVQSEPASFTAVASKAPGLVRISKKNQLYTDGASPGQPAALAWIKNEGHTWFNFNQGEALGSIPPTLVTLDGVPDGGYEIEWWDTYHGGITHRHDANARGGQLVLPVPEFTKDLACRVMRK